MNNPLWIQQVDWMVCHQQLNAVLNTVSVLFLSRLIDLSASASEHVWRIAADKVTMQSSDPINRLRKCLYPGSGVLSTSNKPTRNCHNVKDTNSMNHWIVCLRVIHLCNNVSEEKYNKIYLKIQSRKFIFLENIKKNASSTLTV